MRVDRRWFLACGGGTALALFTLDASGIRRAIGAPIEGGTLDVGNLPKFVTPLVVPPAMPQSAPNAYRIAARQIEQQVLPPSFGPTAVWGYGSTTDEGSFAWPGWTIEARRGAPVEVTWINDLKQPDGRYRPHLLPLDPTLHWANPPGPRDTRPTFTRTPGPYRGPVPVVTHVHGMVEVDDWSDGYPEAWYLPDAIDIPSGFAREGTWYDFFRNKSGRSDWAPGQAVFRYPNKQRPCTLWFHDHTLGITRLNIYAGLAGFYLIRSDDAADRPTLADTGAPAELPSGHYEIPLLIQDRSFNTDGSLFYPDARRFFDDYAGPYIPASSVPPIWVPEFFGNCMVVNGRTWPFHSAEPRRYRLRMLNGCNSRVLILSFSDPDVEMWQIGSEGGLLRAPARLRQLVLAPAERADLIVDFSRVAVGSSVTLRNLGPDAPFQTVADVEPADGGTTGQVMQFRVDRQISGSDTSTPPARMIPPAAATLTGGSERSLALFERMTPANGEEVPHELELGTFDPVTGRPNGVREFEWGAPVSENPAPGTVEVWAFYNFTGDAHPMHVHDVMFELVDRQKLDPETGRAVGEARPPQPAEQGPKDTIIAYPEEVTRVRMTFANSGQFVWHCHIAEHEDNEMMRPYRIGPIQPGQPQNHRPRERHRR